MMDSLKRSREDFEILNSHKRIPKLSFCYCYMVSDILLMMNGDLKR